MTNQSLRDRLIAVIHSAKADRFCPPGETDLEFQIQRSVACIDDSAQPIDVVVSLCELNERHGTGSLVLRILRGRRNIFSIRSTDSFGGGHDFGDWRVRMPQSANSRTGCFATVLRMLAGRRIRSILCVPFHKEELLTSIAIKECFDAPLCAYIMDDQNIAIDVVPDDLMREFLEKCSLRLATHPELRSAYEDKYGLKFYLLPAVAPDHLMETQPSGSLGGRLEPRTCALVGSFWDQEWFDRLCNTVENSGWRIDWYGNNRSPWLRFPREDLERAGITAHGVVSEEHLAATLRKYPFVIVPVGMLDGTDENKGVARLSLPGRILFVLAVSHTPLLVVGSKDSCASRFVAHFQVGETVPYDSTAVADAIERLARPEIQMQLRSNAAAIALKFSDRGIGDWLAGSIERGSPVDNRFEALFENYKPEARGGEPTVLRSLQEQGA